MFKKKRAQFDTDASNTKTINLSKIHWMPALDECAPFNRIINNEILNFFFGTPFYLGFVC